MLSVSTDIMSEMARVAATKRRRLTMDARRRRAYRLERRRAVEAGTDRAAAWRHLERAHVIAQPYPVAHTGSHLAMLRLAVSTRARREVSGQVVRIVLAGVASLVGRVPNGNTGRADVALGATMPIPDDLADLLR